MKQEMRMKTVFYPAILVPNDGKYSVFFPDLPGCLPWGETFEKALGDAVDGVRSYLEMLADEDDAIPEPSSREAALASYAGQCAAKGEATPSDAVVQMVPAPHISTRQTRVNVSFRRYILEMIDRKAEAAGMTRSGFLARAAEEYAIKDADRA
jgi:predicted RNase H-like HicB family nuclease